MQHPCSSNYFKRRAEEERAAAELATNERAAQSHRELAMHYRELASGVEWPRSGGAEGEAGILSKDFRIVP
jgi:hypothetical protein